MIPHQRYKLILFSYCINCGQCEISYPQTYRREKTPPNQTDLGSDLSEQLFFFFTSYSSISETKMWRVAMQSIFLNFFGCQVAIWTPLT